MSDVVETFEVAIDDAVFDDLRQRIERTRWPIQPDGLGWEHGGDVGYLRELCEHWASAYDPRRLEQILNRFENRRAGGLHFIHEHAPRSDGGQALLLILRPRLRRCTSILPEFCRWPAISPIRH